MKKSRQPEEYNPGRVERELLAFMRSEYELAQGLMEPVHYLYSVVRAAFSGTLRRNEEDMSPYAGHYTPIVAQNLRLQALLHSMRIIDDPQTMGFVDCKLADSIPDAALESIAAKVRENDQLGEATANDASVVVDMVIQSVTASFREELARSNFRDVISGAILERRMFGDAIVMPLPRYKKMRVDITEAVAQGHDVNDLEILEVETVGEDGVPVTVPTVEIAVYDGFECRQLTMPNVFVTDLEEAQGIGALPGIFVYGRRTVADIAATPVRQDAAGVYSGAYANIEQLPASQEYETSSVYGEEGRSGYLQEVNQVKGAFSEAYEVPMWLGRIRWDKVPAFQEEPPTDKELREFARKFGVEPGDMARAGEVYWVVEFSTEPEVLLRAQPYFVPMEAPYVAVRDKAIPGETLGHGAYAQGALNFEIMANDALQDFVEQANRIARPMYQYTKAYVDREYRQRVGDQIQYSPDGLIPVTNLGKGQDVLRPLSPPQASTEAAAALYQLCVEEIRKITGVAEQFMGGTGGAESATEARAQREYLEQILFAEQSVIEEFVRRLLQSLLAIHLQGMEHNGGYRAFVQDRNLRIFGEDYLGQPYIDVMITPDMASLKYRVNITTTGSTGDKQVQVTRMQQVAGLLQQLEPALMASGCVVDWKAFTVRILGKHDLSEDFVQPLEKMPRHQLFQMFQQFAAMMMQGDGAGGPPEAGGNPGGAGTPRPDYQRTAAEFATPGEGMAGMDQGIAQQQDAGRPPLL